MKSSGRQVAAARPYLEFYNRFYPRPRGLSLKGSPLNASFQLAYIPTASHFAAAKFSRDSEQTFKMHVESFRESTHTQFQIPHTVFVNEMVCRFNF